MEKLPLFMKETKNVQWQLQRSRKRETAKAAVSTRVEPGRGESFFFFAVNMNVTNPPLPPKLGDSG